MLIVLEDGDSVIFGGAGAGGLGGGGAFVLDSGASIVKQIASSTFLEDFVFGSPQLADDGDTDHDARMFFDKSKVAFRAGEVNGDEWDDANVGTYSTVVGGLNNKASGTRDTVIGGQFNVASGGFSIALGGDSNEATSDSSIATGVLSKTTLTGQHSQAVDVFSNAGDAQYSRVVLFADTTIAAQETMFIANNSSNKLILPASTAWNFDVNIVATTANGALSAAYNIKGIIKRDNAGNTSIVGAVIVTTIAEDGGAAAWDVTADADDVNEALAIKVTGAAATTIHWVATTHLTEVGF